MDESTTSPEQKKYSRSIFFVRNLIIYVVIGVIVFGIVYYLFLDKKVEEVESTKPRVTKPIVTRSPSPEAAMSVRLTPQSGSNEYGTATLIEQGEKVIVNVVLHNAPDTTPQPAHIHSGSCPKPGDVVYPLTNVETGSSQTILDVTMDELMKQMPLAINVHKSDKEAKTYVACGDVK